MKLHRLEMTAFGPFAGTTAIDFDALGADGLFLLHGQTGAGKTTVLDAIAFALYGKVPGARGDKRLHSDHAPQQVAPQVMLEATLSGRRLRVTRTPEFERPKLRGSGTRTQQAKATLAWLDGKGENLSRIPDIGAEIVRLLGMSADQFFQVVLLPQGDFARFLRAENEDREKLLEKLFDTERFGTAETWLADRRRAADAELKARNQAIDRLVGQVAIAAGEPATETVGALESVAWSEGLLEAARSGAAEAGVEVERRKADSMAVYARAEQQRQLRELHRRRSVARSQLDEYAAAERHRAAARAELAAAERAEPVAVALDEARALVREARERTDESARVAGQLASQLSAPAAHDLGDDGLVEMGATAPSVRGDVDLDAQLRRWSGQVGALAELRSDASTADQLGVELRRLRAEDEKLGEHRVRLIERRDRLPAMLVAAESAVQEARTAAATLPPLVAERDQAQARLDAAAELAKRRTELDRARAEFENARAAHLDAREQVLTLRERRLAGMAAELAGELIGGKPCAVCGSVVHPAPAEAAETAVSEEQERTASAAERAAEVARDRAGQRVAELERAIEGLIARGGNADPGELTAALRRAVDRHADAVDLAEPAEQRTAELATLRTEEAGLHEQVRELDARHGSVRAEIASATKQLDDLTERLRIAAGADETVPRRLARLEEMIEAASALRAARLQAANTRERFIETARRVGERARSAGFLLDDDDDGGDGNGNGNGAELTADAAVDIGAPTQLSLDDVAAIENTAASMDAEVARLSGYARLVSAASRPARRREEIERELAAAERTKAAAESVLAEPEIRAAEEQEPEDTAALDAALAQARAGLDRAVAADAEAKRRVSQLSELTGQLWAAVERIAPAQRAFEELAGLADAVAGRGANNRRMSLRSYVLAARLEEVAVAGSVRLRRMSGGRYEFVHSDRAGSHGRRGGLGLDIRDDYTGLVRPAKTLSGGETFMAALALALGLADTVAAESGGVMLDTLFIDEGFGSLDADTLDAVMGVLDELRANGRVVGVVSHVDEMRQRIPSRLHVLRGRQGSHLRAILA